MFPLSDNSSRYPWDTRKYLTSRSPKIQSYASLSNSEPPKSSHYSHYDKLLSELKSDLKPVPYSCPSYRSPLRLPPPSTPKYLRTIEPVSRTAEKKPLESSISRPSRCILPDSPLWRTQSCSPELKERRLAETVKINRELRNARMAVSQTNCDRVTRLRQAQEENRPVGFRNAGNTCYMNAVLQCLTSTRLLYEYVSSQKYTYDLDGPRNKLIVAFDRLLQSLNGRSRAVDVVAFKSLFQTYVPQFMGFDQHDAQEFLRFLVDQMHSEVNKACGCFIWDESVQFADENEHANRYWAQYSNVENSFISDLFCGLMKSALKCTMCGKRSITFEPFWDLSLAFSEFMSCNSRITLNQLIYNYTKAETLDSTERPWCHTCKVERRMEKSYSFQKLPKYLVLHLKRFQSMNSYRKVSALVDFPVTGLNLRHFVDDIVPPQSTKYNLYAVTYHEGTPFTGHYRTCCRHLNSGLWYDCDDASITSISENKLVNRDAYLLFYENVAN